MIQMSEVIWIMVIVTPILLIVSVAGYFFLVRFGRRDRKSYEDDPVSYVERQTGKKQR
jgi:heme/copper-type cytochrome/quinol oxidase subunit 2